MMNIIQKNRSLIENELLKSKHRYLFTSIYYAQEKITVPIIKNNVYGELIDIGSGNMPYRGAIEPHITRYDSLDLYPRPGGVSIVGDVQKMDMVNDNSYDSAICLEVLEHVPQPNEAIREIHRILRPGGVLILSAPHLSRIHDSPHDYYRFTRFGLQYLLTSAGFDIMQVVTRGGLFTFLSHQLSTTLLGLVWKIPIIKQLVWGINSVLFTRLSFYIDSKCKLSDLFPQGYTVLAIKPKTPL